MEDLTGKTFGRLLVVGQAKNKDGRVVWECRCSCGEVRRNAATALKRGNCISCGCARKDRLTTHGLSRTPLYGIWVAMRSRCYQESSGPYEHYGAKGITVCEEWNSSFERFAAYMGPRPSAKHSIDRIDVHGNYEPGNCRWATITQQNRNKTTTKLTRELVNEIKKACDVMSFRKVARVFGLANQYVGKIYHEEVWKEVA
jgi:hypothetical protein